MTAGEGGGETIEVIRMMIIIIIIVVVHKLSLNNIPNSKNIPNTFKNSSFYLIVFLITKFTFSNKKIYTLDEC